MSCCDLFNYRPAWRLFIISSMLQDFPPSHPQLIWGETVSGLPPVTLVLAFGDYHSLRVTWCHKCYVMAYVLWDGNRKRLLNLTDQMSSFIGNHSMAVNDYNFHLFWFIFKCTVVLTHRAINSSCLLHFICFMPSWNDMWFPSCPNYQVSTRTV